MVLNFPASPINGDTYDNFVYDATKGAWKLQTLLGNDLGDLNDVTITSPGNGEALVYDGTEWINSPVVDVSQNSPTSPPEGQLWFNSSDLSLYVYYNNAWVAV